MSPRELIRRAKGQGWTAERTGNDHLRFTHPDASRPGYASSTPGDWRAPRKILADLRRALPAEAEKKPRPPKAKRKRRRLEPRFIMPSGRERRAAWLNREYLT